MLNPRQLAGTVWLAIFVAGALTAPGVRASVRSMLKTILGPKVLGLFAIVIGSLAFFVWLLWREGRWDSTMLYDTIVFALVGGIGTVSRATTRGVTYDARFYAKTVLVNFEVMALFAFVSDFFPFNFWIEFLVVIPVVTLIAMLTVVAEHQTGAERAYRLLAGAQGVVGLALIGHVVWRSIADYQQLFSLQALTQFVLPLVLSMLFIPVLLLVCAVFAYEDACMLIDFKSGQSQGLRRWKKRHLFLRFGLGLASLQAFRRTQYMQTYAWVKSADGAREVLDDWTQREMPSVAATDLED